MSEKNNASAGNPMIKLMANLRFSARPGLQLTSVNGFIMAV